MLTATMDFGEVAEEQMPMVRDEDYGQRIRRRQRATERRDEVPAKQKKNQHPKKK